MIQTLSLKIGDRLEPGMFPMIDDAWLIRGRSSTWRITDASRWYIAQTNPKCEEKALERVTKLGFECYFPAELAWGRRSRITQEMEKRSRPLLPRYLFLRLPLANPPFGLIRQCDGVYGFVDAGDGPATVSDGVVDLLRFREATGDFDLTRRQGEVRNDLAPFPDWVQERAKVLIKSGPFADFIGTITAALSRNRIRTAFTMFGRDCSVELALDRLSPIG